MKKSKHGRPPAMPKKASILFTVVFFVVLASAFILAQIADDLLDMDIAFGYIITQLVLWGVFFALTFLFFQKDYLDEVELFFEIVALFATVISITLACWDMFTPQGGVGPSFKEIFDFLFSGVLLLDAISVIAAKTLQIIRMVRAKREGMPHDI